MAQATLIEVVATSTLFCELLEKDAFEHHGGIMPERSARQYNSHLNARSRAARQLGLKAAAAPQRSLAEYFTDGDGAEAAD